MDTWGVGGRMPAGGVILPKGAFSLLHTQFVLLPLNLWDRFLGTGFQDQAMDVYVNFLDITKSLCYRLYILHFHQQYI